LLKRGLRPKRGMGQEARGKAAAQIPVRWTCPMPQIPCPSIVRDTVRLNEEALKSIAM
jgi:hypothetical protein